MQRASARTFEKEADHEGSSAYAKRQAALRFAMLSAFESSWEDIRQAREDSSLRFLLT